MATGFYIILCAIAEYLFSHSAAVSRLKKSKLNWHNRQSRLTLMQIAEILINVFLCRRKGEKKHLEGRGGSDQVCMEELL